MEAIFTTLVVMTIAVGGMTTIADHQKATSDELTSSRTEVSQATAQLVSGLTTVPGGELSTSASRD
jgi:hypothetical protein